jgi:hypothetical protein
MSLSTIYKYWALHKKLLWRNYVASNNPKCLSLKVKCPTCLSDSNKAWNFLARFSQKSPLPDFTDICPVGVTLTDGHDEAKGAVRDYENVPQNKHKFRRWKLDSSCSLSGFSMHGSKISRRVVTKLKFRTRTLIVWLSVGSFGRLWARTWAFRLHKKMGISWVSELLLASPIQFCLVY